MLPRMVALTSTTSTSGRDDVLAAGRDGYLLRVACAACDRESVRQGSRASIGIACGACESGVQHVFVRSRDLDDQHLPLLAPNDREAALRDVCDAGDAEWARSSCLSVARQLLASVRATLRCASAPAHDIAVAVGTLVDAAEWRALARQCRVRGAL
jgi:hypothetical protein